MMIMAPGPLEGGPGGPYYWYGGGRRRPCAFTAAEVKRALRAIEAAGWTPGRLTVARDGSSWSIELVDGGRVAPPDDGAAYDDDEARLLRELEAS